MTSEQKKAAKLYFRQEFADAMLKNFQKGHHLSKFKVNPFLVATLSKGILNGVTPIDLASTLLYPRVFGTSATTKFGDRFQKFCIKIMGAKPSSTKGMDIEFDDKVAKLPVIMQLKAGPNTINSGDVDPILSSMRNAYRLLIQNKADNIPVFALGIVYGTLADISGHYRKIADSSVGKQVTIPIFAGRDFWHRLTGDENSYAELIEIFVESFEQADYSKFFKANIDDLATEIEDKYFTDGEIDLSKF